MMVNISADISPDFRWNKIDAQTIRRVLPHEGTPEAIRTFARYAWRLTDYGYWFLLSTLWVNYTGWSDLDLWKRMFFSSRPNRETSIMKPSELTLLRALPEPVTVFRAHRPDEQDWIAYTLNPATVAKFAVQRSVSAVKEYRVHKVDILALFLRRGEYEVLVLDKGVVEFVADVPVIPMPTLTQKGGADGRN